MSAVDTRNNMDVAIKIIKGHLGFSIQANTEIEILKLLNKYDEFNMNNIMKLITISFSNFNRILI